MRLADLVRLGAVFSLVSTAFASCSNGTDDALINACRLVVETCHRGTSVGDCIDDLGSLSPDCIDCIGASKKCGYPACQVQVTSCRIPPWLVNPKDFIDAGTRKPDGSASTLDAGDSGSSG